MTLRRGLAAALVVGGSVEDSETDERSVEERILDEIGPSL
jgi:hypothetical protein